MLYTNNQSEDDAGAFASSRDESPAGTLSPGVGAADTNHAAPERGGAGGGFASPASPTKRRAQGRRIVALFLTTVCMTLLAAGAARAQGSNPPPPPPPAPPVQGPPTFRAALEVMTMRAARLIPYLEYEVTWYIFGYIERLSWVCGVVLMLFSFARLIRENQGGNQQLGWWTARIAVCMVLMGSGPYLISYMKAIGHSLAFGTREPNTISDSRLARAVDEEKRTFAKSYRNFTDGCFVVKVDGQRTYVDPRDGIARVMVPRFDREKTMQEIAAGKWLDSGAWNMTTLWAWLNVARTIIEFGDMYLMLLHAIVVIFIMLGAPFMIAIAVDQKLAQRASYPFLWGVITITLVWPTVSQVLRLVAYTAGNFALVVGDDPSSFYYVLDRRTWTVLTNGGISGIPGGNHVYTILFGAFVMTLAGLMLWLTPIFAYRYTMGGVYETVSSAVAGWTGAMIGVGMEYYSATAAAALGRQAEQTQIQGQYRGDTGMAGARMEAANIGAEARRTASIANARAGYATQAGGIYGAMTSQIASARAAQQLGISSAAATAVLAKGDISVRSTQSIKDHSVTRDQQISNIKTNQDSDTQNWRGEKTQRAAEYTGQKVEQIGGALGSKGKLIGGVVGTGVTVGGSAWGLWDQYDAIQNRAGGLRGAQESATTGHIGNQERAAVGLSRNQDDYFGRMERAQRKFGDDSVAGIRAGAGTALGGAARGRDIAIGGADKAAGLERQANRATYEGEMERAEVIRQAGTEAANLRAVASVVGNVGREASRAFRYATELRY